MARILEAIRETTPSVRFYQASSSEMFGNTNQSFQNEDTRFVPASPYAVAKVFAHLLTQNYRRAYGLYASCGILFNHESPRRGLHFVTRKVTDGAARISLGMADNLKLGNLEARRDWGFAGDYVRAMWLMLQQPKPGDFVIATGVNHSVRDLCELAFGLLDLDYRDYVEVDPANIRPSDVPDLRGDASRAREALGWDADRRVRGPDPNDGRGRRRAPAGEHGDRCPTRLAACARWSLAPMASPAGG